MKHKLLNKLAAFAALVLVIGAQPLNADTVTYIITDPAGSPIAGMNQAGAITWRENYQPFGEKLENSSASTDNDIWFGGKEFDDDTELSFFGARYYEPTIGRFVSIDPQGFDEENIFSFGRYAYGNNNPYKFVDPNGETPAHILAALAVVAARGVVYVARSAKSLGKVVKSAKKGGNAKQTHKGSGEAAKSTNREKVDEIIDSIEKNNYKVKINPKNKATKQEGNVTIDFGDKTKVNLRVETHPLKQNGPPTKHGNVEIIRQVKNKNKIISNKHITD